MNIEQGILNTTTNKQLLDYLSTFLTEERKALFERVVQYRTKHIAAVLEDIYQPHNASAVLRSCDLCGVLDIHIIENQNQYTVNPDVALGSSKWLNLNTYNEQANNTLSCFQKLRKDGYKIVATTPHKESNTLEDIDLDQKIAVAFGTELTGLSELAINNADAFLRIPMYGFTESYNISVSAALVLFTLTERMRKEKLNWQLSDTERLQTLLDWTRRSINKVEGIEKRFHLKEKSGQ
ncbi:MAG: RNA methyltransferase [Bacteroidales bacterium]|nr:RNA methyltransferase [Bacteroidales bacterium]